MQQLMVPGPQSFKLPLRDDVHDVHTLKLLFKHAYVLPTARGPWPRCAQGPFKFRVRVTLASHSRAQARGLRLDRHWQKLQLSPSQNATLTARAARVAEVAAVSVSDCQAGQRRAQHGIVT